jgi:hypothetical protein
MAHSVSNKTAPLTKKSSTEDEGREYCVGLDESDEEESGDRESASGIGSGHGSDTMNPTRKILKYDPSGSWAESVHKLQSCINLMDCAKELQGIIYTKDAMIEHIQPCSDV